ncbi:FAD/NAD(P)-binding domain-containing protein [Gymnopus androsaceus JB14]|uniref:FAD/NAD(P)-binding domain-containing protein n=1 Tax=Gymnopus androsaceus JB14 TaxID=1447944 RepID=A0A6A4IJ55_9AGAR|nr:FAD/NAD(P)-binding domain-containing protein [Gymnopus androsaceus JB14]
MATMHHNSDPILKLDVIIVGGGIGGLATAYSLASAGHTVTVLEAVAVPGEIGAGVQVASNVTRILTRWGLGSKLKEIAGRDKVESILINRYVNGETILRMPGGDEAEKRYGAPTYHVHRADLYNMLYELAKPYITFRAGSRVTSIDPSTPSVTLDSGEKVTADVIIGADGIRSVVRDIVVGHPQKVKYTGDSAYRFIIPAEDMLTDPDLGSLVDKLCVWAGPQKHIVSYGIRGQKCINVVACVEDEDEAAGYSWSAQSDSDGMRAQFSGWESRVIKLLALVKSPHILKFKLMDCAPLETWVHAQGRVTLMGDACHPMLPYRAQGAAMAIEDAEVLGKLFSHVTHHKQIPSLLKAYESIRFERATTTQRRSTESREFWHLSDGAQQEARDARLRAGMEVQQALAKGQIVASEKLSAVEHGRKTRQAEDDEQYGYDVGQETDKWWEENGARILSLI